jgi:ribulose-5-phosphate 4-epimerase/fuculose-1-phosphate aldolase
MNKEEGVIKFQMDYTPAAPLPPEQLREINAWRKISYLLQLIGQMPERYGGYGFGNISQRLAPLDAPQTQRRFVVSGTQTGGLADLTEEHYAVVTAYYPEQNRLVAKGPIRPSSESLTHGAIYDLADEVRWVIHAHSPHIWRHAAALELPATDPGVAQGTPEMAAAVRRLFAETKVREQLIFSMGGHEDGVVSFGRTAEEAGTVMLTYLARAFTLD